MGHPVHNGNKLYITIFSNYIKHAIQSNRYFNLNTIFLSSILVSYTVYLAIERDNGD